MDTAELELGDNLKINLNLNKQINQDITYLVRNVVWVAYVMRATVFCRSARSCQISQQVDFSLQILSRGQVVSSGRYRTKGQVLISLIIPITKDMVPSFRIVAYYHTNDNEIVSDSVWVDVKDTCMGTVRLFKWVQSNGCVHRKLISEYRLKQPSSVEN